MRLAYHWFAGGVRQFDEISGKVGGKIDIDRKLADWGFLWQQRGKWFAIRKDQTGLIFQHQDRTWHLKDDVEFHTTRGIWRQFKILRKGQIDFQFNYFFGGVFQSMIDPAYASLDEEADDFFLYVTELWSYWKGKNFNDFLRA